MLRLRKNAFRGETAFGRVLPFLFIFDVSDNSDLSGEFVTTLFPGYSAEKSNVRFKVSQYSHN